MIFYHFLKRPTLLVSPYKDYPNLGALSNDNWTVTSVTQNDFPNRMSKMNNIFCRSLPTYLLEKSAFLLTSVAATESFQSKMKGVLWYNCCGVHVVV